jgi:hypothetical protein
MWLRILGVFLLAGKGFAPNGTVEIDKIGAYKYSYDPLKRNFNDRTLKGFSTQAKKKMYECDGCPYSTYNKFYKYYGVFDYANEWILAAFKNDSTNFTKGNADFILYGMEGNAGAYFCVCLCLCLFPARGFLAFLFFLKRFHVLLLICRDHQKEYGFYECLDVCLPFA